MWKVYIHGQFFVEKQTNTIHKILVGNNSGFWQFSVGCTACLDMLTNITFHIYDIIMLARWVALYVRTETI